MRDLAVVRIDAGDLPWLELGDVSRVPLGSGVLVAGSPQSTDDFAITPGSVSAFRMDGGRNIGWIQTDVPVDARNSGGPVLNLCRVK